MGSYRAGRHKATTDTRVPPFPCGLTDLAGKFQKYDKNKISTGRTLHSVSRAKLRSVFSLPLLSFCPKGQRSGATFYNSTDNAPDRTSPCTSVSTADPVLPRNLTARPWPSRIWFNVDADVDAAHPTSYLWTIPVCVGGSVLTTYKNARPVGL